jgi:hypothetical protein
MRNFLRYFALTGKAIYFAFAKCDIRRKLACDMIFVLHAQSAYRAKGISPEHSEDIARFGKTNIAFN